MYSMMRRICVLLAASSGLYAQMGAPAGGGSSSRAIVLPQSGRVEPGGVTASENANPGTGVTTLNSSVSVSGDFTGAVPARDVPTGPLSLTLADAVRRGLAANLGTLTADNTVRASRAQRIQELSALLPNISAQASQTEAQVNLAASGFQFKVPAGFPFSIPSVVGPFGY
jgi:hypothetical protein